MDSLFLAVCCMFGTFEVRGTRLRRLLYRSADARPRIVPLIGEIDRLDMIDRRRDVVLDCGDLDDEEGTVLPVERRCECESLPPLCVCDRSSRSIVDA